MPSLVMAAVEIRRHFRLTLRSCPPPRSRTSKNHLTEKLVTSENTRAEYLTIGECLV